jgi:hypothetical protein
MEINQKLDEVGIGTKESEKLSPQPVTILGTRIEIIKDKDKIKEIGKKVVLMCKHPKKEEPIEISAVEYIKDKNVKVSGLWITMDSDGLIQKGSTLAMLLVTAGCKNLKELTGKILNTTQDARGYLCIKAY